MPPFLGALRLGLRRRLGMGARLSSCWTFVPAPPLGLGTRSVVGAVSRLGHRCGPLRTGTPPHSGAPRSSGVGVVARCSWCAHSQQPGRGSLLNSGGSGGYVYIALGLFCRPRDDRLVCLGRGSPLLSLPFLRQVSILASYLPTSLYLTLTTAWFGTAGAFTRPMTVCSQTGSLGGGGVQQAWLFFP